MAGLIRNKKGYVDRRYAQLHGQPLVKFPVTGDTLKDLRDALKNPDEDLRKELELRYDHPDDAHMSMLVKMKDDRYIDIGKGTTHTLVKLLTGLLEDDDDDEDEDEEYGIQEAPRSTEVVQATLWLFPPVLF